ncbi:MAG: TIR domain-containing protein [Candidatus Aminicenantes bacterium]
MNPVKKILILAANPKTTPPLRLDEEVREIDEGLRRSKCRDQFEIQSRWAVRMRDLRRALLDVEPQIVHFTGHGKEDGLLVEDELGMAVSISTEALSGLFELCTGHVECVVLGACYSEPQAAAISKHIKYVIGMRKEIKDKAAIEFVVGFYDALGAGKSVEKAFYFGRNAIQLFNIPGHLVPCLLKEGSVVPPTGEKIERPLDKDGESGAPLGKMKGNVFISYSSEDFKHVLEVRKKLEEAGLTVWMGAQSLVGGEKWGKELVGFICQADVFVACISSTWVDREILAYKEVSVACELEKKLPKEVSFIIPVRLEECNIPRELENRQQVDLHVVPGIETLLKAIRGILGNYPENKKSVPPGLMEHLRRYLEYLVELGKTSFFRRCEILATILIGLLIAEVGILQEWAPSTQHPNGFPGWNHPASLLAVLCSVLAGVICIVCNIWFMKCARKKAENLSQRPERFYFLSGGILLFALVTSFFLLLPTTRHIPALGDTLSRVGPFQVFKALLIIGLEIFVLLWPSWFYAVWVRSGMLYERPALLAPDSKQIAIIALIAILGIGMLQWTSLKNPHEVGYDHLWRTIHIEVQGILMIALAWTAWWLRYIAERLERKGNRLREQSC